MVSHVLKNQATRWWVYMLFCSDGSLYTGATNDVEKRLATHQSGKGARYTRARLPVSLVYKKRLKNKNLALKEEARLKKLRRDEKLMLLSASVRRRVVRRATLM